LLEDRLLEALQIGRRIDPEFFEEIGLESTVGTQGIGLASTAVEGEHELRPTAFPKRVRSHRGLQIADHGLMLALREASVGEILLGGAPQLLQAARRGHAGRLVGEIGEGRPPPKAQGVSQNSGSGGRVAVLQELAALTNKCLESESIDCLARHVQDIARRRCTYQPGGQYTPQIRDVRLNRLVGGSGGILTPKHVC
jgi:hypothetical protein